MRFSWFCAVEGRGSAEGRTMKALSSLFDMDSGFGTLGCEWSITSIAGSSSEGEENLVSWLLCL